LKKQNKRFLFINHFRFGRKFEKEEEEEKEKKKKKKKSERNSVASSCGDFCFVKFPGDGKNFLLCKRVLLLSPWSKP
jgi:hypothetical protein